MHSYTSGEVKEGLLRLREPFPLDQIELLPKYCGRMVDDSKGGRKIPPDAPKSKCSECGGYHYSDSIHLSYVGHAGITDRLLDVDPFWTWEPAAYGEDGTPRYTDGGMWIRLTVLGMTRLGYGDAGNKKPPFTGSAVKEIIGDAIRNAAMRFGAGTYLWSKSEHAKATLTRMNLDEDPKDEPKSPAEVKAGANILEQVRALRVELGMSDDDYAAELEKAGTTCDTDLCEKAAVKMLAGFEVRVASVIKARQKAEAKSAIEELIAAAKNSGSSEGLKAFFAAHGGPNPAAYRALSAEDREKAAVIAGGAIPF